jgi:tetratricopeptide (TPR) repeat protein
LKQALTGVVLYVADTATDEGRRLSEEHAVRAYPTFVLLNDQSEAIDSWIGYGKASFIEKLSASLEDPTTIAEKKERFARKPEAELAARLASYHAARSEYREAVQLYRVADRLNQDPDVNYLTMVLRHVHYGLRDSTFTPNDLRNVADSLLASPRSKPEDLIQVGSTMVSYIRSSGDTALAAPYIAAAVERTGGVEAPDTTRARKYLLVNYELYVTEDGSAALERRKAAMPEGWEQDFKELFFFTSWCADNRINLEGAKELGVKALSLARREKDERYPAVIRNTLSGICLALGDTIEAAVHTKAAQPEGWTEDPARLNSVAWWCFENSVNLEEAEAFARRGVDLAQPGREKAMVLDTLAEICHARGRTAEAVVLIQEAIREDPEDTYYQEQLDRFQAIADRRAVAH